VEDAIMYSTIRRARRAAWALAQAALFILLCADTALAMPEFARRYKLTCSVCHTAFPRLSKYGEFFVANNMRLPNWRDTTIQSGDDRLALPDHPPFAVRAQAYVQARTGKSIDPITGETERATTDFQAPYLVKILSSSPLSDTITYYFYAILAEKGANGEALVEDAWVRHSNLFGSGIGMQLGQFQLSDVMFPREVRLPFQDYMVYRMAGVTYDRGVLFDRDVGPIGVDVGLVNGNGIEDNLNINSPGYRRPDKLFDNNNSKSVFGHLGTEVGPVTAGFFALWGRQRSATGPAATQTGERDTDKRVFGADVSGAIGDKTFWYGQYLWNSWDGFLDVAPTRNYRWHGGFAGVDHIPNDRWALSLLYNVADANDFDRTNTIYEGIDINSLSATASYYFMRNVKGVIEANGDFLDEVTRSGPYYTGHLTKEHYVLVGFDLAF
jgi:hypothetical protein